MKRNTTFLSAVASVVLGTMLLAGCATIFKGTTDTVNIASMPAGADVYVNGNLMGTTPLEVELKSNETYLLEFKMKGYLDQQFRIHNSLLGGYLVLDILFGFLPVIVDAVTGAWMSLEPDMVNVPLRPAQ